MLIPIIKIKENGKDDTLHIVGTNSHDRLFIKDNAIHYLNRQCYESSEALDGSEPTYRFVGERSEYTDLPDDELEVEMWDIERLIEFAIEHAYETAEHKVKIAELFKKYYAARQECEDAVENTGVKSTSGELL